MNKFAALFLLLTSTCYAQTFAPIRVACGPAYTDSKGQLWSAGKTFFNTENGFTDSHAIAGTSDPALFQTQFWSGNDNPPMRFTTSLPNGSYLVNLPYAEIFSAIAKPGQRVFNVLANGAAVLPKYDVVAAAGAQYTAVTASFPVKITTGSLTIEWDHVTENPFCDAIEIVQLALPPPPLPLTVSLNLTWSDKTPVVGTLLIYQISGTPPHTKSTLLASAVLDANGAASVPVQIDPGVGDPLIFLPTFMDSSGVITALPMQQIHLATIGNSTAAAFVAVLVRATLETKFMHFSLTP